MQNGFLVSSMLKKKRITFSDLEEAYKRFKKEEAEDKNDLYLKMYS